MRSRLVEAVLKLLGEVSFGQMLLLSTVLDSVRRLCSGGPFIFLVNVKSMWVERMSSRA